MRQLTQEEAERIHLSTVKGKVLIVADEALSDASHIGVKTADGSLKTAPLYFVEQILLELAQSGALDKMYCCSIERWAQPSMFM